MTKKSRGNNVVSAVWQLAEPFAKDLGLTIWDVKFVKEGSDYFLRIFIDSENGITIDDCENMSRDIDRPLDELDPISQNYCLEVCSPGLNRELTRDEHLEKNLGEKIIVRLIRPMEDGTKQLNAVLISFSKEELKVSLEGGADDNSQPLSIPRKNIAFIKLDDFEN